ncbi:MAG: hypothetical protein ACYDGR_06875 [Candidatus Dormibacteria bacterium]
MKLRSKVITLTVASSFVLAACGGTSSNNSSNSTGSTSSSPSAATVAVVTDSPAADLRVKLNLLLGEHLILASKATGAALGGRKDEFAAYGALLNTNGTDIGDLVGAAYGDAAKTQFNGIWSAHNGFFVDYTVGVATKDKAKQDKAVNDLVNTYIPQFSKFISGATGLPEATVADLTKTHVLTTKDIVDKQGAKDWPGAAAAVRKAYKHMELIGDPLAEAIAAKFPDKFTGDPKNKGVDLRVGLNQLLQEHLYLASYATDAALGGRSDEFKAYGSALNDNGTDLGDAIGSLYGDAAKTQFNGIWSAHNGFFVDYTTGVATKDKAKMDKAVNDLVNTYIPQFSEFIAGATGLPKDAVAELTKTHVLTTKDIVDAQGAKAVADAATKDRKAAQHMEMIADPLAKAIVAKLPDKFKS